MIDKAARISVLSELGASDSVLGELLAYGELPESTTESIEWPLADEPHVQSWQQYLQHSKQAGVLAALKEHLVQLRFPVRAGLSQSAAYLAATRKGQWPAGEDAGVTLLEPLELHLESTPAGHIPVLTAGCREDFEVLYQALAARNEPEPVPASMGACIVAGFNNWSRIREHRREWEASASAQFSPGGWSAEFKRYTAHKPNYQDRFILLSRGPYSGLDAQQLGIANEDWLQHSLVIRRVHECTHYLTARGFGSMRNLLLDELVADYFGLVAAFGNYDPQLAAQCFGVDESQPSSVNGRLANYRGTPALSDAAFSILARICARAVRTLGAWDALYGRHWRAPLQQMQLLQTLFHCPVEALATEDGVHLLNARLTQQTR